MSRPLNIFQRQGLDALAQANPALRVGPGSSPSPYADGGFVTPCGAERVMLTGGQLTSYLTPDSIVPFEAVFRRLPIDGIFTATPGKPCQFEMGTVQVPISMGLVILDTRFAIYRPSGAAAGDFVELEDNRLSTQVGWDILSNVQRQGNYRYELNPLPPASTSTPAYQGQPNLGVIQGVQPGFASDDAFDAARAQQVQLSSGGGLSMMPQRHHRQGLLHVPAPWVLHSSEEFIMNCSVFRAIQIPIAFFESEVFGFMIPDTNLIDMQKSIAPCISKPGGI